MRYYPTFLDLRDARCLIVGIGAVGRRKLNSLLAASPAEVLVLDTFSYDDVADAELKTLLDHPGVTYADRPFEPSDVAGRALVFACTGSRELNAAIAQACTAHGVPCNVIDAPEEGSFIVPAHFEAGDLLVALSTGGASPALAKRLRRELQAFLGSRFSALTTLMRRLRPLVLALGHETGHNTNLFRSIVDSELIDALQAQDRKQAESVLQALLPHELHQHIGALLHDIA